MRAYSITITRAGTSDPLATYASFDSFGKYDTGALNIELDIPVFSVAAPQGNATLKIWGIGLPAISSAHNLVGETIKIYGGMANGLPLANPDQYGLLLVATIFQCYGNWQGIEQTLDFVITSLASPLTSVPNIVLNWVKGQTLGDAAVSALTPVY